MVGGRLVASPLARGAGAAMSLVRADGFCVIDQDSEGVEAGERVNIILSRGLDNLERTVVSIGSHDLCLDILADLLPNMFPGVNLSGTHVGSLAGLMALKNKEAHIAPVHLLDESTGTYNEPILRSLFTGQNIALIKGLGRVQGIMTRKGNPLGIKLIEDLPKGRFVNRQRGAGTRVLLDYKLKAHGIDPSRIEGYSREAATHMAVAAAVQSGSADAGLGILSAAKAMGLDFYPVGNEEYDFAIWAEHLELPHVRAFAEALKAPEFLRKMSELGGYSAERCGEVVMLER
jgi:putative molybdopterin biosynthesis protein